MLGLRIIERLIVQLVYFAYNLRGNEELWVDAGYYHFYGDISEVYGGFVLKGNR